MKNNILKSSQTSSSDVLTEADIIKCVKFLEKNRMQELPQIIEIKVNGKNELNLLHKKIGQNSHQTVPSYSLAQYFGVKIIKDITIPKKIIKIIWNTGLTYNIKIK